MEIRKFAHFSWGSLMFELGDGFNAYGMGLQFFGEDNTVQLSLHLHWGLYIGIEIKWLDKIVRNYEGGWRLGANISGRYFTLDLFNNEETSTIFWDWWRAITGKPVYKFEILSTGDCEVILPEKRYPATFVVKRQIWDFPRWGTYAQSDLMTLEIPGGIPVPGKGENNWDMGDDGITRVSSRVDWDSPNVSLRKAAEDLAVTVLRRRQQYASLDWLPKEIPVGKIIHQHGAPVESGIVSKKL